MTTTPRPPAWAVLEQALLNRRPVRADYHGRTRDLSPHALGWKNGRAKVLAHQAGDHRADPTQQWRSFFVDELDDTVITDQPWHTAPNYTPTTNGIDELHLTVAEPLTTPYCG